MDIVCSVCGSVNVRILSYPNKEEWYCSPCSKYVAVRRMDELDTLEKEGTMWTRNNIGRTRPDLIPGIALHELGDVFGEGSITHGENNWKDGKMPSSIALKHAMTHLFKYMDGDRSEKHLAKVMFGMCVMIYNDNKEDCDGQ